MLLNIRSRDNDSIACTLSIDMYINKLMHIPNKHSSDIQLTSLAMEERKLPGASGAIHKLARARHAFALQNKTTYLHLSI